MKTLIALLFVGGLAAQTPPMIPMATGGGPVGGATNLTTVGAVPYVSATGTLNQDPADFFWDATNNRLGIGTATPVSKLDISDTSNANLPIVSIRNTNGYSPQLNFDTYGYSGSPAAMYSVLNIIANYAGVGGGYVNFNTKLQPQSTAVTAMTILGGGNVGIGTTTPVYGLDVAKSGASGTFRAYDATASTGSTLAVFRAGVAQSGNVLEVQNNAGSNVLSISATGQLTSAVSITAGGNVNAGVTQDLGWSTRSTMTSPSSGVIALYNNAQTDFNRLQFGGTTSSFPSIQRSTTKLFFRLADDSAGATVRAGGYESSDGTAGATVTTCTGFKNGLCISGT